MAIISKLDEVGRGISAEHGSHVGAKAELKGREGDQEEEEGMGTHGACSSLFLSHYQCMSDSMAMEMEMDNDERLLGETVCYYGGLRRN